MIVFKCDKCGKESLRIMEKVLTYHLCKNCIGDYGSLRTKLDKHVKAKLKEFFTYADTASRISK